LNLCSDRFDNHGGNAFEDGNAIKPDEFSKQYPGCTPEIIRQKLRSDVVIEDLARRHIHKKEKKEASQEGSKSGDSESPSEEIEEDNPQVEPVATNPQGWSLIVPPVNYQIYKKLGTIAMPGTFLEKKKLLSIGL